MQKLNWVLILSLALSGPIFAGLTIMAWIHGYEHWVALIFIAGIGKFSAFFSQDMPKRHAFIAGFLAAFTALCTQAAFSTLYLKNNPEYAAIEIPLGLEPTTYTLVFSPIGGLMGGTLAMSFSALVTVSLKIFFKKTGENS